MTNLAFSANYYDIAATAERWTLAEEDYQMGKQPMRAYKHLPFQLHEIVEIQMPKRWEAFQIDNKRHDYIAATRHLLTLLFDSRRASMCHSLTRPGANEATAIDSSRTFLHDSVTNAYYDHITPETYSEPYIEAMNGVNLGVSIEHALSLKKLVQRSLSLTCDYVNYQLHRDYYFFPAPNNTSGSLEPYKEFEQFRCR